MWEWFVGIFLLATILLCGANSMLRPQSRMMSASGAHDFPVPSSTLGAIWVVICMFVSDWIFFFTGDPRTFQKWLPFPVHGEALAPSVKKRVAVIYCHPSDQSHNHKVLEAVCKGLSQNSNVEHHVIDLYKNQFDPRISETDYTKTGPADPKVLEMQAAVAQASHLIFIYPVWWYGEPALLKGFLDRVFSQGFSYRMIRLTWILRYLTYLMCLIPGLTYILQPYSAYGRMRAKSCTIFRTYGGPWSGKYVFGNTQTHLEKDVLRFVGLTRTKVYEMFDCDTHVFTQEYQNSFLASVSSACAALR